MAAAASGLDAPRRGGVTGPHRVRVLHVITSLAVGGAERVVLSAAGRLAPDRFEHAICCLAEPGPLAAEARELGIPVYCIGRFPGLRHPIAFARLVALIRRLHPTIVHTQLQSPNLYGRAAARLAGVPVVIATEQNVYANKQRRYIHVERLLLRSTAVLIAVSHEVRRVLAQQLRVPETSIRVVPNGIAPVAQSAAGAAALRARTGDASHVIATVASLTPKKGHEHLLRAVARLNARGARCALLLAGDGPERPRLESLAASLGIGACVHLLGATRDVGNVLAASDVFVLPSLTEGMPLALLEAMSLGKAVVATSVGGVPELISPDVNGILVPPADDAALAEAIGRLLASAELRARLGAEARQTVAGAYTEAAYLDALDSIYTEAVRQDL